MAVSVQGVGGIGSRGLGNRARERPLPGATRDSSSQALANGAQLRNTVALLFAILLISLVSLLFMGQAANLATSGYKISQLQEDRDQLLRQNQELEVQLAQLHSLPVIQKAATDQLHMTKGDLAKVQYVNLDQRQLDMAKRP